MKSKLFYSSAYKEIEAKVKKFLNRQKSFLSKSTAQSPRAVGDAIQEILSENFQTILGSEHCSKYSSSFARRAMADFAFEDQQGFYYVVDVKTHNLSTKFNMPNLTSVERLARFYEDDHNYFVILMVTYEVKKLRAVIKDVKFIPIEFLDWGCLTIGALGWGQIQIANSNVIKMTERPSRKKWMIEMCDILLDFYPKEIGKIHKRIERFEAIKKYWQKHPD